MRIGCGLILQATPQLSNDFLRFKPENCRWTSSCGLTTRSHRRYTVAVKEKLDQPLPTFSGLVYRCRSVQRLLPLYRDLLGIPETEPGTLTAVDREFTLRFVEDPAASVAVRPDAGLYHAAFLLPDRSALAAVVRRLLKTAESHAEDGSRIPFRFEGGADHLVSEAVYLRDAENNGVELYADRDSTQWQWDTKTGTVAMTTEPLDFPGLLAQSDREAPLPPGSVIGHLHLHVPNLDRAESVYREKLGMTVTHRDYPGMRFLAWGRYHHHLAINTFGQRDPAANSVTAEQSAADQTTGLMQADVRLPHGAPLDFRDPAGVLWHSG